MVVAVLFLLAAILMPVYYGSRPDAPATACLSNVKQISLAHLMYAADWEGRYAPSAEWMDTIMPYSKNEAILTCPNVAKEKQRYGYSYNSKAAGTAPADSELPSIPLVYDSTSLAKNTSDPVTSLPAPGRHDGKDAIGFADGHAKYQVIGPPSEHPD